MLKYEANVLFKFVLEKRFSPDVKILMGKFERVFHTTWKENLTDVKKNN